MRYAIDITGSAVLVKPPSATQLLSSVLEVSAIDEIDVQLVAAVDSLSDFRVDLLTSMDADNESGWQRVVRFDNVDATKSGLHVQKRTVRTLLRYLRWQATATGAGAANFTLQGVARSAKRGSRFVPTDLADLSLWMDASQIYQLDNTNVVRWSDLSPNGNSASQSNVNFQPVYLRSISSVGGRPGVKFDGIDDSLTCEYGDVLGDLSVYMVFQAYGTPNWTYERFLGKTFTTGLWVGRELTTANRIGGGVLQAAPPFGIYDNGFTDGSAHVLGLERSGTTARLFKGNTEVQSATVASTATSNQAYVLGAEYNSGYAAWGKVHLFEVVVCKRALSAEDRGRLVGYLKRKWGV